MSLIDHVTPIETLIEWGCSESEAHLTNAMQKKVAELAKEYSNGGSIRYPSYFNSKATSSGTCRVQFKQEDGTHVHFTLTAFDYRKSGRGVVVDVDKSYSWDEHFWAGHVARKDEPESVRVDGTHYRLGKNGAFPGPYNGFGGAKWRILFNDGREVTTYDLWYQGTIPPQVRDELPDNAVFVKERS